MAYADHFRHRDVLPRVVGVTAAPQDISQVTHCMCICNRRPGTPCLGGHNKERRLHKKVIKLSVKETVLLKQRLRGVGLPALSLPQGSKTT